MWIVERSTSTKGPKMGGPTPLRCFLLTAEHPTHHGTLYSLRNTLLTAEKKALQTVEHPTYQKKKINKLMFKEIFYLSDFFYMNYISTHP